MTNKRMGAEPAKTSRARVPQNRRYTRIVPPNASEAYARHADVFVRIGNSARFIFDLFVALTIIYGIPMLGMAIAGGEW